MTMYTLEVSPQKQLFELIQIDDIHKCIIEQSKSEIQDSNEAEFFEKVFKIWERNNGQNIVFSETPEYFKRPMIFLIHLAKAIKEYNQAFTFDEILEGLRPYYNAKNIHISESIDLDIVCAKAILR